MAAIGVFISMAAGHWSWSQEMLEPYPTQVLTGEIVSFGVKPSFHFELKAPQRCEGREPLSETPRRIRCRFSSAGKQEAILSVCDNAKTFCRPLRIRFDVKQADKNKPAPSAPSDALKDAQAEIKKKLIPGFEHALPSEIVSSNRKPVLLLISTDWCPPCNELKEIVLSTPAFLKMSQGFRRIYVDGDSPSSKEWAKYVNFIGYPTLAVLTPDLKEVSRYFDRPNRLNDLKLWLADARSHIDQPIADVLAAVKARKRGSLKQKIFDFFSHADAKAEERRVMEWAIESESQPTLKLFSENDIPADLKADWLELEIQKSDADEKTKKAMMERVLAASENTENFSDHLSEFCDMDKSACKPWVKKLKTNASWWEHANFASPSEKEAAIVEDEANRLQIFKAVGDEADARKAGEICRQNATEEAKASPLKVPRAALIASSYCLEEVGRFKEAEAVYRELLASYPSESTFFLRYAKFLFKQKRLKDAHVWAEKAEKSAYGYNWMRAVELKAKIEIAMKDRASALKTIHSAMEELDLTSQNPDDRDQSWALALREMEESLAAQSGASRL